MFHPIFIKSHTNDFFLKINSEKSAEMLEIGRFDKHGIQLIESPESILVYTLSALQFPTVYLQSNQQEFDQALSKLSSHFQMLMLEQMAPSPQEQEDLALEPDPEPIFFAGENN